MLAAAIEAEADGYVDRIIHLDFDVVAIDESLHKDPYAAKEPDRTLATEANQMSTTRPSGARIR